MKLAGATAMVAPASACPVAEQTPIPATSAFGTRMTADIAPRLIRFRDAPRYLGMDRNRFNAEVRPFLTEVPVGKQGIGFDRLELDRWFEDYKSRNGRPARKGSNTWDANKSPASSNGLGSGMSTNASVGGEFAKALAALKSKKRNNTSRD